MARSLRPLSNFIRTTSRIFRIDNLSVGMDTSLLKRGPIGRLDCRRTRLPNRPHRMLTIPWKSCSRSRGLGAHDPVETALTIRWILHRVSPAPIVDVIKAVDEAAKPAGAHR
jgi:hypothetical protein